MVNEIVSLVVSALISVPGAAVAPAPIETIPVMAHNVAVVEETAQVSNPMETATRRPERGEFRGVWVTTVINLDFPSTPGLSNTEIKREIDYIIDHSRSIGLNAIILQVRPAGDAIYPSQLFPWSKYLTGEQGLAPADGFDPLAYWLERTHANGMELHAWINPYRVTHSTSRILDVNLLHPTNPARLRPDLVVPHGNALYLDPGFPDARQLIIDGIVELLTNYDLDGIHFDDYFYPGRDFNDSASFALYGQGQDHRQWRINNVNSLIYGVRDAINESNPNVSFGISPTGIWANANSDPRGSATRGYQHYIELAADSLRWINEGWIDYIIPQIYWHIGFDIACYEVLLRWWENAVRGTDVELHIGHAAWREHESQNNFSGEILRQMQMNEASDVVQGSVFFRWRSLRGPVGDTLQAWYAARPQELTRPYTPAARQAVLLMEELDVVLPSGNTTVALNAAGHTIFGSSIPSLPLYMNGTLITNRTPEGFFAHYALLPEYENVFEFTQPGQPPVVRKITRSAPAPAAPGPVATPPPSHSYSRQEPHYATVTADVAWLLPNATLTGGSNWLLSEGMTDRIIESARGGEWLRLSNGGWIEAANVSRQQEANITENILSAGNAVRDENIETITWPVSGDRVPAARAVYEDGTLTVFFGMQTEAPTVNGSEIFESAVRGVTEDGIAYIKLTVAEGSRINGFDIRPDNGNLALTVMTPRSLSPSWRTPFDGFTFVIDPGHGGTDYGALGPMGRRMAEKHLNLINSVNLANRLEELGAEVHLVRDNNEVTLTLRERIIFSRDKMPDMFISMHANSVAETTDATNIRGFTIWYRNPSSHHLANLIMNNMYAVNPGTNRWVQPNQANFYVCRPTWAPHILLETSFMSNIDDFAWMINPVYQEMLAEETVAAILAYFLDNMEEIE